MQKNKNSALLILIVALLVTGNLIGAGILALPIQTGLAGFVPSLFAMLVLGGAMYYSAVVLGKEAVLKRDDSFNYPSLYNDHLGVAGKWVAILANIIILYGLLTAYLTGATSIICNLFNIPLSQSVVLLMVFAVMTSMTVGGIGSAGKFNAVLTILMFAAFAVIAIIACGHVDPSRLKAVQWAFLPNAMPVIVTAFHFHNIIPTICGSLKWELSTIWKTMLIGMIIGYAINAIWIFAGIGSLPITGGDTSIVAAFEQNLPATVPLAKMINSTVFVTGSLVFAILAIFTSYIANGMGLQDFVKDMLENHLHIRNRLAVLIVTFAPPLLISLIYPDIFLKAINVVGGVGIVVLFGILPSIIGLKRARSSAGKIFAMALLILFSFCLLAEIGQETGLLKIKPETESWNTPL